MDEQWVKHIQTVISIKRHVQTKNTTTNTWFLSEQTAIYISNKILRAEQAQELVKNHWSIENGNHYVRDVSLLEDDSKIRKKSFNFSVLRSFVLNIFRRNNLNNIKDVLCECSQNWIRLYSFQHLI